jgi:hypothetical protein
MRLCTVVQVILGVVFLGNVDKVVGQEDLPVVLPAMENGDVNGDWSIDVSDPVFLLNYLYSGGPAPVPVFCQAEIPGNHNGDVNGDGAIDLSDCISLLLHLFSSGREPTSACGIGDGSGAQVSKIPFTARLVFDNPDPPAPEARLWIDGGGNLHLRNGRRAATVSGDFVGRFEGVANLDVDAATFVGTGFGTFVLNVTWQGKTGTWSGSYSATLDGANFTARSVAQGSGGLSGTRVFATSVQEGDDLIVTGHVLTTAD